MPITLCRAEYSELVYKRAKADEETLKAAALRGAEELARAETAQGRGYNIKKDRIQFRQGWNYLCHGHRGGAKYNRYRRYDQSMNENRQELTLQEQKHTVAVDSMDEVIRLFGVFDENLNVIEEETDAVIKAGADA